MNYKIITILILIVFLSISNQSEAQSIAEGNSLHTIVVNDIGELSSWGHNPKGELGLGHTDDINDPTYLDTSGIVSGVKFNKIAVSGYSSYAISTEGRVYSWGDNNRGALGYGGNDSYRNLPVLVEGIIEGENITEIAAAFNSVLVLSSTGQLYSWGEKTLLGNGDTLNSRVPVEVDMSGALAGKTVTKITAGNSSYLILTSDNKLFAWGNNSRGQLGNGNNTSELMAVPVKQDGVLNGKTITDIEGGGLFAIALTDDGKVYCWGQNNYGQLGNASVTNTNEAVEVDMNGVMAGKIITKISAGNEHCLALSSDGEIFSWGYNDFGQLGDSSIIKREVPVKVNMSGVLAGRTIIDVVANYYHSLALSSNGKVYAWGQNTNGQLGNRNNIDSSVPVICNTGLVLTDLNENPKEIPNSFSLNQNYPNPFNPSTRIKFTIPAGKENYHSTLKVFDVLGNEVVTLVDEQKSPGTYEVNFNAGDLSSGIYFYRLTTNNNTITKKMMLIK